MKAINKLIEKAKDCNLAILAVLLLVLSCVQGYANSEISELFSTVEGSTDKNKFFLSIIAVTMTYTICHIMAKCVGRVMSNAIMLKSYSKLLNKIFGSKVSSTVGIGTGAINNATNTIANANISIASSAVMIVPNIVPFIFLTINEYRGGGMLTIAVNVAYLIGFVSLCLLMMHLKSNKSAAIANAQISNTVIDSISNIRTLKYFHKEAWASKRYDKNANANFVKMTNIVRRILSAFIWSSGLITTLLNSYLCWGNKSIVLYIALMDCALINIGANTADIIDSLADIKAQKAVIGSLEKEETFSYKKSISDYDFRIANVEFKYPDSDTVFSIDKLEIKKGGRYSITGKSGTGKSTFIKVLSGIVGPTKGHVDSYDILYMAAESELFNDTLYNNITLGNEADKKFVLKILKDLDLEFTLEDLDKPLGEKGEGLSTGQKQRINLARVILHLYQNKEAFIALDEVTSALDEETSIKCINSLCKACKKTGATVLYVSNKSDYKATDLITDHITARKEGNVVTYTQD